ncbi:MAG: uroporphyrinogen decarboxylase family protein [Candidatus Omnitrophica bacterium]|nr:uroporphyrinogen decarboxylase family protein [Candidatus Omnitrophota bacterium]
MLDEKVAKRINLALNFKQSDRVPVCEFLDNPRIFEYFCHNPHPLLADKVKAYHQLGIDICWRFERRQSLRYKGIMEKLQRFALRQKKINVLSPEELNEEMDDFKQQQKLFYPFTCLSMSVEGCLSIAYKTFGFEEFCKKMYVELLEVEKLIDICAENLYQRAMRFAEQDLGPLFFIKDHIAYEKGLIFSKNFLLQHWIPKIKHSIEPLKQKNIKVILHSQGNFTELIDDLLEAGFDGIHPIDSNSGMNIGLIKKQYARSLLLFGNVDLKSKQGYEVNDINTLTQKCLEQASYDGGHFIGTVHGISKDLKLQQILCFFAAIRDLGAL